MFWGGSQGFLPFKGMWPAEKADLLRVSLLFAFAIAS
jgi:hypothetical protein